jgi:hypothetical protein
VFAEAVTTTANLALPTSDVHQLAATILAAGADGGAVAAVEAIETYEAEILAPRRQPAPRPGRTARRSNPAGQFCDIAITVVLGLDTDQIARTCPTGRRPYTADLAQRCATHLADLAANLRAEPDHGQPAPLGSVPTPDRAAS